MKNSISFPKKLIIELPDNPETPDVLGIDTSKGDKITTLSLPHTHIALRHRNNLNVCNGPEALKMYCVHTHS